MKKIGNGETLINFFTEERSLVSSKVYRIDIFLKDEDLSIDLYLELLGSKNRVKISFCGIKEYSFYHHSDYIFYNIETVKFFKSSEGIYISLDPIDERECISDEDKDYIFSNEVEGFIIE
jgi:hypothetical protein